MESWQEIILILILIPIAFLLSIFIPAGLQRFVARRLGEKAANNPVIIFGILSLMMLSYWLIVGFE